MAYYAIYNRWGVHVSGVSEDLLAFATKQDRDLWVADHELGANDAVVASAVTRAQAIYRVGLDVVNVARDAIDNGKSKVKVYRLDETHYACDTI